MFVNCSLLTKWREIKFSQPIQNKNDNTVEGSSNFENYQVIATFTSWLMVCYIGMNFELIIPIGKNMDME